MSLTDFNQAKKADVKTTIPFFCKIGQTKAELFVMIESDPHGDGRGTHAHFQAAYYIARRKKLLIYRNLIAARLLTKVVLLISLLENQRMILFKENKRTLMNLLVQLA